MCRSYSGDPSSTPYACDCHLHEDDSRGADKALRCAHGKVLHRELCEQCRTQRPTDGPYYGVSKW